MKLAKQSTLLFLIIILLVFQIKLCVAQQIEHVKQIDSLPKNGYQELAYIQTSKDIYEAGEDLLFKVYLLDAQYLTPSIASRTLYLQLLSETDKKIVWQEKYEIEYGFADGRVYLNRSLPEGDYLIAAYTSNSFFKDTCEFHAIRKIQIRKNAIPKASITAKFDKKFYSTTDTIRINLFPITEIKDSLIAEIQATLEQGKKKLSKQKVITDDKGKAMISFPPQKTKELLQVVIDIKYKDKTESIKMPVINNQNPLQFAVFPEGGYLVTGIAGKVAFKAVSSNGEPIEIKGTLFENNAPLIEFKSIHAGMGSFCFTPVFGKKYFIRLSEPAIDSTFILPEINREAMTLQLLSRDKEYLSFKISQSQELEKEDIYIRVQCRGVVYLIKKGTLKKELLIQVPLNELPQGIVEVTLFNSNFIPVAERLVYVNQERKLNIAAELSNETYSTKGKVTLKIKVTDEKGKPILANLGVSVFDRIYKNNLDSNNILIHYYLSTQLNGRIYNPSYYFNSNNNDRVEALDMLMLTQGWRKYVWNEMNLKKYANSRKKVIFDDIRGKITSPTREEKNLEEQVLVKVFSIDRNKYSLILVDSAGDFTIGTEFLKLWEGHYIYLKPICQPYSDFHIELKDPFETIKQIMSTNVISYPLPALIEENKKETFSPIAFERTTLLPPAVVSARNRVNYRDNYLGYGDDYVCIHNVLNCPRHVMEQGTTKPEDGNTYFVIQNYDTPNETVVKLVYPDLTGELISQMSNFIIKAYYGSRVFYKPNYDKDTVEALLPDYRNTLLWEPSLFTDKNGEVKIIFYCSDINSQFIGRIEGVSVDGLLGEGHFKFKVKGTN